MLMVGAINNFKWKVRGTEWQEEQKRKNNRENNNNNGFLTLTLACWCVHLWMVATYSLKRYIVKYNFFRFEYLDSFFISILSVTSFFRVTKMIFLHESELYILHYK